jgi:hypothetical protein
MANKQTRALRKLGLSLRFKKGVDFSHLSGRERAAHPEFEIGDWLEKRKATAKDVRLQTDRK